jgi:hypothetical protein
MRVKKGLVVAASGAFVGQLVDGGDVLGQLRVLALRARNQETAHRSTLAGWDALADVNHLLARGYSGRTACRLSALD